ncbi:uncharacterized protein LOC107020644 isoform X2 [Solanum pennellii]|uniref:Uncharacterized protein LOC107020644 isoform X2 n=1 Tax=Solanum pennellii TaxID=28526 RepID=A0ABM1VAV6_SOLPN|nr:uncharacterized protein LOC107020644 isoform X2 [Solanum pennellii]XP_027772875.1 uncharacterized protein LOC107020644 isoform X2 [Solanum pennellii]
MRFKRGSKVEVMNMKQSPASRRRAENLSDNGYMYTVRYDYYPGIESMGRTERVSRKNIRSCTPCVESLENQEIGQVVEVFDESSWKMATIVKVLDSDYYLVHQTGCLKELCVHRSNTRVVQCWQDEERHLIRKGSELCRRSDQLSALKPSEKVSKVLSFSARNRFHAGDDHLASQECTELRKSHISSSLLLNRVSQVAFSKNGTFRNIRDLEATERVFKRRRVVPASLKGQVNVDAKCKENIMAEKYVHDQLKDDGYCALEKTKRSGSIGYFLTRSTESSDACSVGSCSINEKFSNLSPEEVFCQGTVLCSDAESCHDSADKEERHSLSSPVKIAASIHSLELHAYRCTLEALYASGPLSWDQEALLTNLRISLHISNDEHLAELKTLISAGTGQQLDVYILCLQKSKDDACICSTSPGIIWRTPTTTVPQIRQFMAFVVITIKLHDLFCLDNFDIGMLFPEK